MNRGVSGKLVATQFKSVHQHISGPSESTEKEYKEAMAETRELALSVTDAIPYYQSRLTTLIICYSEFPELFDYLGYSFGDASIYSWYPTTTWNSEDF